MRQASYFVLILALILAVAIVAPKYFPVILTATASEILSYIGVVVTLLSLSTSLYFLVLAVSAFGHIRDIETVSKAVNSERKSIEEISTKLKQEQFLVDDEISKLKKSIYQSELEAKRFQAVVEKDKIFVMKTIVELTNAASELLLDLPNSKPEQVDEFFRIRARYAFRTASDDDQRQAQARALAVIGDSQDRNEIRAFLRSKTDKDSIELLKILSQKDT